MRSNYKPAFTIVEATLAMSFIGVLLVTVSYIIIQMSAVYQKTIAVKSVNAAGREVSDDFSHYIKASTLINTNFLCGGNTDCENDGAYKYIYQQYYSDGTNNYIARAKDSKAVPTFGMFCTGRYSYAWNSGYVLNGKNKSIQGYRINYTYTNSDGNKITSNDFRLIRVEDPFNQLCSENFNGNTYTLNEGTYNLSVSLDGSGFSEPEELLNDFDAELAIYDLRVYRPGRHALTYHAYYSGTFILATLQGDIDIMANDNYCKTEPEGYISEFSYCAINKFNFAARAIGETND